MRYWQLTFVLLAFWLGQETGAQQNRRDVETFGTIECKRIVLLNKDKRQRLVLVPGGLAIQIDDAATTLVAGSVSVYGGGRTNKAPFIAELSATSMTSTVRVAANDDGPEQEMEATARNTSLVLRNAASTNAGTDKGSILLIKDAASQSLYFSDQRGEARIVAGAESKTVDRVRSEPKRREVYFDLFDSKGRAVSRLPKK